MRINQIKKDKTEQDVSELREAVEVDYNELSNNEKRVIDNVMQSLTGKGLSVDKAYDGIHGKVVKLKSRSPVNVLDTRELGKLAKISLRWIEFHGDGGLSVGI